MESDPILAEAVAPLGHPHPLTTFLLRVLRRRLHLHTFFTFAHFLFEIANLPVTHYKLRISTFQSNYIFHLEISLTFKIKHFLVVLSYAFSVFRLSMEILGFFQTGLIFCYYAPIDHFTYIHLEIQSHQILINNCKKSSDHN